MNTSQACNMAAWILGHFVVFTLTIMFPQGHFTMCTWYNMQTLSLCVVADYQTLSVTLCRDFMDLKKILDTEYWIINADFSVKL